MAELPVDATPAELAASLTIEDVPSKLRCVSCSQLAIEAVRTPCCDQNICDTCQKSMGPSCPVCLHEPVSLEDCRPNKALRTTVKVFVRNKNHEKQVIAKKDLSNKVPSVTASITASGPKDGPTEQESKPSMEGIAGSAIDASVEPTPRPRENANDLSQALEGRNGSEREVNEAFAPLEEQKDIPRPSIESPTHDPPHQDSGERPISADIAIEGVRQKVQSEENVPAPESQQNAEQYPGMAEQPRTNMNGATQMGQGGFGFDGMNGSIPNMGFGNTADYSQMMQLSAMQNSMMGMIPGMMPIPGMNMDPLTMAQMYSVYGGQGMGMSGVSAGMNFTNGQGAYGGFNGQPGSWNGAQNNYNQNTYGGHANGMVGDYGPNAGFGGYSLPQGNFNQIQNRQFPNNDFQNGYHGQGFQTRGRGRGRGHGYYGRGRGGYGQMNSGYPANHEAFHNHAQQKFANQDQPQGPPNQQPDADGVIRRGSPVYNTDTQKSADDFSKSLDPGDAEDYKDNSNKDQTNGDKPDPAEEPTPAAQQAEEKPAADLPVKNEELEKLSPIETVVSSDQNGAEDTKVDNAVAASTNMPPPPNPGVPTGPAALSTADQSHFYDYSSRGRGRGFYTGGAYYRGGARGRGASFLPNGGPAHIPNGQPSAIPTTTPVSNIEPKGVGVEGAPKGPKAMREGVINTGVNSGNGFSIVGRASAAAQARANGRARSPSPSPSRSRSRSPHRSHRHRHHRHRSTDSAYSSDRDRKRERRHRRSRKYDDEDLDDEYDSKVAESSSKRSSHRHRDDEKDRESGRSHRSHRSHRDRSKDRDGHRSSRRRSRSPANDVESSHRPNGITHTNGAPPTGPKADREKAKEAELTSSGRKRREREDDQDDHYKERKRSKPEYFESADDRRSSKHTHREGDSSPRHHKPRHSETKTPINSEPPTPKIELDPHTLEREARNRERMQKEMQRRSAMDGKGPGSKRNLSDANGNQSGRRVSYKYEDEESSEARASRVENEREAGRWG